MGSSSADDGLSSLLASTPLLGVEDNFSDALQRAIAVRVSNAMVIVGAAAQRGREVLGRQAQSRSLCAACAAKLVEAVRLCDEVTSDVHLVEKMELFRRSARELHVYVSLAVARVRGVEEATECSCRPD